ncbi:MAG: wbtJ [Bacteroidota bacterium]|nr:wbtJ [Bacteroidota bacterium]
MYKYKRLLIISDNLFMIKSFHECVSAFNGLQVDYCCSAQSQRLIDDSTLPVKIKALVVKEEWQKLIDNYDLIFSLHCKQLFPAELVTKVKCINVHPGYNPYNRGWFPQVFSIINKLPVGATIHEIDEHLDHGSIIARKKVEIEQWDTSYTVYNRVQAIEVELLKENLDNILKATYTTFKPEEEGNVNLKKDFNALCKIDPDQKLTMLEAIDKLRALTHTGHKNAYFIDKKTGSKIYVSINLQQE